jgi:centromere-localized protein 2
LSGHGRRRKAHTLQSVHSEIEDACVDVEAQIEDMESEIQDTLSEVQDAIGELSDLRYGSFSKSASGGAISEEVLATLKRLEAACAKSSG